MLAHHVRERILARMAEGGVTKIMRQGERLGQVFIEPERTGDRAGDLRDFDRMGKTRAVVIPLVIDKDLGLVFQASEGSGMDDAVAVALIIGSGRARWFLNQPPTAFCRIACINLAVFSAKADS